MQQHIRFYWMSSITLYLSIVLWILLFMDTTIKPCKRPLGSLLHAFLKIRYNKWFIALLYFKFFKHFYKKHCFSAQICSQKRSWSLSFSILKGSWKNYKEWVENQLNTRNICKWYDGSCDCKFWRRRRYQEDSERVNGWSTCSKSHEESKLFVNFNEKQSIQQ